MTPLRLVAVVALVSLTSGRAAMAQVSNTTDRFLSNLSDEQIFRWGAFGTLVPAGGKTNPAENKQLATALLKYKQAAFPDEVQAILEFVNKYPHSAWNTSLLLNLGDAYRNTGRFSQAVSVWQKAWLQSGEFNDPTGKALADAALGKLAAFYAYVGDEKNLAELLNTLHGRALTGPASEEVSSATVQLAAMRGRSEFAFRCGALALNRICLIAKDVKSTGPLYASRSTAQGMSLVQLLQLSKTVGLDYQMAYRDRSAQVLIPAVIHWKIGHYAAILGEVRDSYRISDSLGRDLWVRSSAIDEEATGYFLVPAGKLPKGWRSVSGDEGAKVWGRGQTGGNYPHGPGPTDPQAFAPGCGGGGNGNTGGMPSYNVAAMSVSLELHDRLLSYKPALGPTVGFEIFYNQRDYQNDGQPGFYYTNFGPKWTSNWISYIDDSVPIVNSVGAVGGGSAVLYLRGGGLESYTFNDNPVSAVSDPGLLTQAVLTKQPIEQSMIRILSGGGTPSPAGSPGAQGSGTGGAQGAINPNQPVPQNLAYEFIRQLPDGSTEIFAKQGPSTSLPVRYFLTQVIDPQGRTVTLTYDSMMRITSITDAVGQVTQLIYNLASDPRKVTAVVDPFGRSANFFYSSDGTHLVKTVDPGGIESTYTYGQGQAQMLSDADFISSLTTPYGITKFATSDILNDPQNLGIFWRTLTITDALGQTARVDQREHAPNIPDSESDVPAGMTVMNEYLSDRNVFVWDPYQLSIAMQTPNAAIGAVPSSPDYTKARILHFLHSDTNTASFVLESTKNPLENRVWYLYSDQVQPGINGPYVVGSSNRQNVIGRVLDGGMTAQVTKFQYNGFGHVTQVTDPVNRQYTFQYSPNLPYGIDLTAVIAGTGSAKSVLFSATYNGNHEPLTVTDAAGEPSTITYDPGDLQISTFTNALNQTIKFTHDPISHFLTGIEMSPDNVNYITQLAVVRDAIGRIYSLTDELGYSEVFSYDSYDRPINVLFPDGTSESWTYNLLDLQTFADRMNRKITYQFDADRRLQKITDPLGRLTQFGYCQCHAISSVTDPAGNTTTFNYDADDRMSSRKYADGSQTTYSYEATTSRLKSVTDATGRGSSYSYNADDTLSAVGNPANGGATTVGFKYDPVFVRLTSMTDTFGTTTYSYYAAASGTPSPGAMQVQTEIGPYGDVLSYGYDALGRQVSRTINVDASSKTFDNLGRLNVVNNPLGTRTYSYVGTSNRVAAVSSSPGPQMQVSYYGVTEDDLPKQVSWFGPPPAPAPPSRNCTNDEALLAQLQTKLAQDQAWLNRWCSNTSSSECQQSGASYRQAVSFLTGPPGNGEIGAAELKKAEDCAPHVLPPSILASFNYAYDADDEITQIAFGGNLVDFPRGSGAPSSTGAYSLSYDADGELTAVTPVGNQSSGPNYAYRYDIASNILQMQSGATGTNNNSYNNLNQLMTSNLSSASYDGDGNLSTLGETRYGWNTAGETGSVPANLGQPHSFLTTGVFEDETAPARFRYDGWGRLTEIIESSTAGTSDMRYVWCGYTICQEHDMKSATSSLPGGPVTKAYFDQGVLVYDFYPYYYTRDLQGSVYHVLNSGAEVEAQYQYDPYGNQVQVQGNWSPTDIGYTGLFQHQPSGLELAVFRAYSPALGRWLSRDPLGELADFLNPAALSAPKNVNLYAYAGGSPLTFSDPAGLCIEDACVGEIAAAVAIEQMVEPELPELQTTVQELVDTGWQFHHIFPQEFVDLFEDMDIDIDQWTIFIPGDLHTMLHAEGWNQAWEEWLEMADELGLGASEAGDFGISLLQKYGLWGPNTAACGIVPYPGP